MNIIKIKHIREKGFDCECCGYCIPEGLNIYFNDVLIWNYYRDNHLYSEQTEESILSAFSNAFYENKKSEIDYSEQSRHKWNVKCPGNGVARTPESWKEFKDSNLKFLNESYAQLLESCKLLPNKEVLSVKIIALWIEDIFGEVIEVIEE